MSKDNFIKTYDKEEILDLINNKMLLDIPLVKNPKGDILISISSVIYWLNQNLEPIEKSILDVYIHKVKDE